MSDSEPQEGEIGQQLIRPLCQQCRKVECKTLLIPVKYKCPECGIKTCSLPCVNAHKEATGCTGKKRVHGFVKMNDFTLTHLWRDYSFINERMNKAHSFKRKYHSEFENSHRLHLKKLRNACRMRGGFRFHMAPSFSKQHAMNNSYYDHQSQLLYWSVLLIVKKKQSQDTNERWLFITKPQCERRTLLEIFREYVLKKTKFYSVGMNSFLSDITLEHILKGSVWIKAKRVERKQQLKVQEGEEIKESQGEGQNVKRNLAAADFGRLKLHAVELEQSVEEIIQGTLVNEFPILVLEVQTQICE